MFVKLFAVPFENVSVGVDSSVAQERPTPADVFYPVHIYPAYLAVVFILVETDAPYLTPEPFRGKRNTSPMVEYTAAKVAEIKGLPLEEVARITKENAMRFYGIS